MLLNHQHFVHFFVAVRTISETDVLNKHLNHTFTKIKYQSTRHALIIGENSSAVSAESAPLLELFRKKEQQKANVGFNQGRRFLLEVTGMMNEGPRESPSLCWESLEFNQMKKHFRETQKRGKYGLSNVYAPRAILAFGVGGRVL